MSRVNWYKRAMLIDSRDKYPGQEQSIFRRCQTCGKWATSPSGKSVAEGDIEWKSQEKMDPKELQQLETIQRMRGHAFQSMNDMPFFISDTWCPECHEKEVAKNIEWGSRLDKKRQQEAQYV